MKVGEDRRLDSEIRLTWWVRRLVVTRDRPCSWANSWTYTWDTRTTLAPVATRRSSKQVANTAWG